MCAMGGLGSHPNKDNHIYGFLMVKAGWSIEYPPLLTQL
jgi:hypothetical protein